MVVEKVVEGGNGLMKDGFFWRNGERWLRERGKEFRLLDLAPNLERGWMLRHADEVADAELGWRKAFKGKEGGRD
jgi:hypothetical protein